MSITLIVAIILLGLAFLFIEFFLIPGGGVVGILGLLVVAAGVYLGYQYREPATGHLILAASMVSIITLTIIGFRRIANLSWADQETIDSRVNEPEHPEIKKGDQGVTFNDLRPNGAAVINDKRVEVYSIGEFIDRDSKVEVVRVEGYKIYVKPIKT